MASQKALEKSTNEVDADAGYATLVEKLKSLPPNVLAKQGLPPIAFWSLAGDEEIIQKLLAAEADVDVETDEGLTPLMYAVEAKSIGVCRALVEADARVDKEGSACTTALMRACQKGLVDIAAFLIESGADVNHEGKTGDTPLLSAVAGGSVEAVELLIDNGANVNHVPACLASRGFTPLMLAALNGDAKCASALVEGGADVVKVSAKLGWSALDVARRGGRKEVMAVLQKAASYSSSRLAMSKAMWRVWPIITKVPVLLCFVFVYYAVHSMMHGPEEQDF